jgi:hypothetical protein
MPHTMNATTLLRIFELIRRLVPKVIVIGSSLVPAHQPHALGWSATDQRVVFGEVTPKGRTLMDKVFPAHGDRLRHVTTGLSASEKRAASQLLRRLTRQARRIAGERITEDD